MLFGKVWKKKDFRKDGVFLRSFFAAKGSVSCRNEAVHQGSLCKAGGFRVRTAAIILLTALCMRFGVSAAHRSLLQQGIAEKVVRFHVLANSDSEEDQCVKYRVRDAVLTWMEKAEEGYTGQVAIAEAEKEAIKQYDIAESKIEKSAGERGAAMSEKTEQEGQQKKKSGTCRLTEKMEVQTYLVSHLDDIEAVANRVLAENKVEYHAKASLEQVYFPERTYESYTFPAGWYDALRISLGEAKGRNWWCVLYPKLCFSDCLRLVAEEKDHIENPKGESKAKLKEVLSAEEYESLLQSPKKWKLAFRWF